MLPSPITGAQPVRLGLILALTLCLLGALPTPGNTSPLTVKTGEKLAVIGMKFNPVKLRRRDQQRLQDGRFGFGLNTLLAEAFYETQTFQLIEGKELQKRELINDLAQTYWVKHRDPYPVSTLPHIATQLDTAWLAYGSISHIRSSRRSSGFSVLSRHTQTLRVTVEVCLYAAAPHTRLCRKGRGEANQKGSGVLFTARDNRLDFEQNAAGIATQKAVVQAVANLMQELRGTPTSALN